MEHETVFGDICARMSETDIEDIFKERKKHSQLELDTLKNVLINLSKKQYTNRREYDREIKLQMRTTKGKLVGFPGKVELNILYRKLTKTGFGRSIRIKTS